MISRRTVLLQVVFVAICAIILHTWIRKNPKDSNVEDIKKSIILWDDSFVRMGSKINSFTKTCGKFQCYFTTDRKFQSHPLLKAILFYGPYIDISDLMIPRAKHVQWGLFKDESPRYNPIFVNEEVLNLFNYSATFSRYSDVSALEIPRMDNLTSTEYFFVPFEKKIALMSEEDLAPLLYIQSDNSTTNNRDEYISELMKYIRVDSYGASLNNRKLPDNVRNNLEIFNLMGKYKFILAFEDADCEDYITYELWNPLILGSIPVYYGSPSFKDWLPNEKSAISVRDFPDPKKLAEFIQKVSNNKTLYNQYLTHKLDESVSSITNDRLVSLYAMKSMGLNFYDNIHHFECHVCEAVNTESKSKNFIVTRDHYNCPLPISALTQKPNSTNPWLDKWTKSKCEAKLLAHYVAKNKKVDKNLFYQEVKQMRVNKEC